METLLLVSHHPLSVDQFSDPSKLDFVSNEFGFFVN